MTTCAFSNLIFKQSDMPDMTCLECGKPLVIHRIEPVASRFDLQTFSCKLCDLQEVFVVELDAVKVNRN